MELKEQLTSAGSKTDPEAVGYRSGVVLAGGSSFTDPICSIAKPYYYALAQSTEYGVPSGTRIYDRVGRRINISTSTEQDLNDNIDNELTSTQNLKVVSSSTSDDISGTGIQKVIITGLDNSGKRISEIVNMKGQTAVQTVNSFKYMDWFSNWGSGIYGGTAAGDITCTNIAGTTVYAKIAQGHCTWRSGRFYVQSDVQKAYLHSLTYSSFRAPVQFDLYTSPLSDMNTLVARASITSNGNGGQILFPAPLIIPSGGRILVKVLADGNGAEAYSTFVLNTQ